MKSPIQTAFEKLSDEELKAIYDLASDRKKGAQARLWVLTNSLENERKTRRHKTKGRPAISLSDDPKSKREFIKMIRSRTLAELDVLKADPRVMAKIDDPDFMGALYAIHGVSPITSKCTTSNHFKVHHFGWVFSAGLRVGWQGDSGAGRDRFS